MLVLSRRKGERICVGPAADGSLVWITVVEVDRGKVRIGVECPAGLKIMREELLPDADRHGPPPYPASPGPEGRE